MRKLTTLCATLLVATTAAAQLTLPPPGDNQKSSVTQHIGSIDYNSPDVHAPNGDDRRGKIWGQLVPYGMTDEAPDEMNRKNIAASIKKLEQGQDVN